MRSTPEVEHKMRLLEPHCDGCWCTLTAFPNCQIQAWKGATPVNLPHDTVNKIMRSSTFDRGLYKMLVDTLDVDVVAATEICLDG